MHAASYLSWLSRRQVLKTLGASLLLPCDLTRRLRAEQPLDPPADEAAANRIRVVSSNVRYGSADDGDNRWERRRELLADVLRQQNADLIGTQEMLPFQAEFLRQQLDSYTYVGRSRELDNDEEEQCGIYYRPARFVQLEAGHFWLSSRPELPGSQDWDAALPRMATWLKLFDRQAERPLLVVNTHFDHRGRQARLNSAVVVRDFVKRYADRYPVVVTGDFNCGEDSDPHRELVAASEGKQSPLRDVYRLVHPERQPDEGTFNGFEGRRDGPRIDWILATDDFRPVSAVVVTAHDQGRYPSDHFPVLAELEYAGEDS